MAMRPDEFYQHALSAADAEGRLPLARMTEWDISPFDQAGLHVAPLRPPTAEERPRHGEDPADCGSCARRARASGSTTSGGSPASAVLACPWCSCCTPASTTAWRTCRTSRAAELGVLTSHIARHIEALDNIARAHVYRIGDGGAHLHVWFFARPAKQPQLMGSWLVVWDDLLPEYPEPTRPGRCGRGRGSAGRLVRRSLTRLTIL